MQRDSQEFKSLISLITNLNAYSFSKVRDKGMCFHASAIFSHFFQGAFGPLRKRRAFPDRDFDRYVPLDLFIATVNHAVKDSIPLK